MGREEHQIVYEGKYIRARLCGRWEYVERNGASAGVVIAALTPENKLLLVEQFRVPMQQRVIELPAGLAGDLDDPHEAWLQAAKRELHEETGYEADQWVECTFGPPSAGLSTEQVAIYLARGLKKTARGGGEASEDIQLHEIPLEEVPTWLREKQAEGLALDPKIFAGLYFLAFPPRTQ
jgi:ADP-ribose pyrophosphatase